MSMSAKELLVIHMDSEHAERFAEIAQKRGLSASALAEDVIDAFLQAVDETGIDNFDAKVRAIVTKHAELLEKLGDQ